MNNFSSAFLIVICVFFILLIRLQLNVQNIYKKQEIQINKIKKTKLLKYITANMEGTEQEYKVSQKVISEETSRLDENDINTTLEEEILAEQEESIEEPMICTIS